MDYLKIFDLFLFDFDGLLVNTEHIHYQAYIDMLALWGFHLDWTFLQYCSFAHVEDNGIKEAVYTKFPDLFQKEPNWERLRQMKNNIYLDLLLSGKVEIMPGVQELLNLLNTQNIRRCVVTNAKKEQIDIIKKFQPILNTISHWVTREDYLKPKPDPECYLRAISLYGRKGDRIIGFEDTLRGLRALRQTSAKCVLISSNETLQAMEKDPNIVICNSLQEFLRKYTNK